MTNQPQPVVVGIDGSDTAVNAAVWAIEEAVSRDTTLRLVYATKARYSSTEDYEDDIRRAKASLQEAEKAVTAANEQVKTETAIVTGPPGFALGEESQRAAMVCVGSVGIGGYARAILGSVAADLAEKARCTVAIIRPSDDLPEHAVDWIVVGAKHELRDEPAVEHAMREADLRHLPVLLVGNEELMDYRIDEWKPRYPDVHVYPVTADSADVGRFLKKHHERIALAVIGASDADELTQILGPHGHHSLFHRSAASVLVVRH